MVSTFLAFKPGLTPSRRDMLLIMRPAPESTMSASATSDATNT